VQHRRDGAINSEWLTDICAQQAEAGMLHEVSNARLPPGRQIIDSDYLLAST
jgi:hypothetical protein